MSDKPTPSDIPVATPVSEANIPDDAIRIGATATHAYTGFHQQLHDGFAQDFIDQGTRLDETAKQLLTLQVAIPGLFAALLKLLAGDDAVLANEHYLSLALICGAFISWVIALFFSLQALKPEQHLVNPDVLENKSTDKSFFGLIDFYQHNAARKHQHITLSSVLTVLGLLLMVIQLLFLQGVV